MSRHFFIGRRMPKRGWVLGEMSVIFSCPVELCEWELSFASEDAAYAGAVTHCRCAGGEGHDRLLVDLLAGSSPLFAEWIGEVPA